MGGAVKLLGRPEIICGASFRPAATKGSAALYYLAYLGDWVNRDDLLYLFWPDCDEARARGNLRQLLSTIRRQTFVEQLAIDRNRLYWEIDSDAHAFQMAISEQNHALAVQTYTGPLLLGFRLHGAPEFESWLELERGQLHDQWRRAALAHSAELVDTGLANEAGELLERLLKAEPLDEAVLRQLLATLPAAEAMRRYKRYQAELARELGAEPEPATLKLVSALSSLAANPVALSTAGNSIATKLPSSRQPHALTPFVGRSRELEDLTERILDNDCKLLTILAPGGMGKTRIALEVGLRLADALRDGVCFVPLVTVNPVEAVVPAIAGSLGLVLVQGENPFEKVVSHVRDKLMLLILDNLEHLPGVSGTIVELLDAAPSLKVLATSRERLDVQAEWVYDLPGLAFPGSDQEMGQHFDAVQLFIRVASRVDRAFALSTENAHAVRRICRLSGGMPLAIELAASWLRVLTVDDIASELEDSLDLLRTSMSDVEPRHLSIRAVFDHSWKLLSEAEQQALRQLSVFQGGFTREAARDVAGIGVPLLLALRNKSFLTLEPTGRFSRHPLLGEYLRERAGEQLSELEASGRAHAEYFASFLEGLKQFYGVKGQRHAFELIEADYQNIVGAWSWAAQKGREDLLDRLPYMLVPFLLSRCRDSELQDLLNQGLSCVLQGSRTWAHLKSVEARMLLVNARRFDEAYSQLQSALEVYKGLADQAKVANGLRWLGVATMFCGRVDEALRLWDEAVDVYRTLGDEKRVFDIIGDSAVLTVDLEKQKRLYDDSLAFGRRVDDLDIVVHVLSNYANTTVQAYGDYGRARELIDEAVELERRELGMPFKLANRLSTSSFIYLYGGDLITAERHAMESRKIASQFVSTDASEVRSTAVTVLAWARYLGGDVVGARQLMMGPMCETKEARSLQLLARLAIESGDVNEARQYLRESMARIPDLVGERYKLFWRCRWQLLMAEACTNETETAEDALREGLAIACRYTFVPLALEGFVVAAPFLPVPEAEEVLSLCISHPAATFETRQRARKLTTVSGQVSDDLPITADGILAVAGEVMRLLT